MNARSIPFLKMNGLGNDFVVWDAREKPLRLAPEAIAGTSDSCWKAKLGAYKGKIAEDRDE